MPAITDGNVTGQSMAHPVTFQGPWFRVGKEGRVLAEITWANTGSPVGTLSLRFLSADGSSRKKIPGTDAEFTSNGNVQPNSNVGDNVCYWRELPPGALMAIDYASSSGGAANASLNVRITTW